MKIVLATHNPHKREELLALAGNLLDMFKALTPANDLEWHRAINVPTIRVDGMMVAGD